MPIALIPRTWDLMTVDLGPQNARLQGVQQYIQYVVHTWVPKDLPVTAKSFLFDPKLTNLFNNPDDQTNNNVSESYNSCFNKKLGGFQGQAEDQYIE